jgi:hypothetical protein
MPLGLHEYVAMVEPHESANGQNTLTFIFELSSFIFKRSSPASAQADSKSGYPSSSPSHAPFPLTFPKRFPIEGDTKQARGAVYAERIISPTLGT